MSGESGKEYPVPNLWFCPGERQKHPGQEGLNFNPRPRFLGQLKKFHHHLDQALYLWLGLRNFSVIEESSCPAYPVDCPGDLGNGSAAIAKLQAKHSKDRSLVA